MQPTYYPDRATYRELASRGHTIPICRDVAGDLETPVSVFLKIADGPYAFLLESVEQGERIGRYSFIGANPNVRFQSKGDEITVTCGSTERVFRTERTALDELRSVMAAYQQDSDASNFPFCGGAVGYLSYDVVREIERLPEKNPDDLDAPDCNFMIADTLIAFDHIQHKMTLISNATLGDDGPDAAYDQAVARIEELAAALERPLAAPPLETADDIVLDPQSTMTQTEFEDVVARCKEYILAGDIFQVVPSQRFGVDRPCDPFQIYRALRMVNPSPYMFYLKLGDIQLAGSSPEILCRLEDRTVTTRPIAGTRPRGATPEEDLAHERDLLADPKEIAEHIMLVDLGRNDIGRVCEYHTVKADELKVIERYSHVMHIVSNVVGELREGLDAFDLVRATFPAGTLTGAPKIRAMEIIEEMEPVRRGPYAGSVGYFSFNGNLDACITIRTIVMKDGKAYVQAGAGIVADSVPENEYIESCNKARGMLKAIELAARGLRF